MILNSTQHLAISITVDRRGERKHFKGEEKTFKNQLSIASQQPDKEKRKDLKNQLSISITVSRKRGKK